MEELLQKLEKWNDDQIEKNQREIKNEFVPTEKIAEGWRGDLRAEIKFKNKRSKS